jgi:hypothetical protein
VPGVRGQGSGFRDLGSGLWVLVAGKGGWKRKRDTEKEKEKEKEKDEEKEEGGG